MLPWKINNNLHCHKKKRDNDLKDWFDLHLLNISEKNIIFSSTPLGSWAQGLVHEAASNGTIVVVKSIPLNKCDKLASRKIKFTEIMCHPNLITLIAAVTSLTNFHIVMKKFSRKNLEQINF